MSGQKAPLSAAGRKCGSTAAAPLCHAAPGQAFSGAAAAARPAAWPSADVPAAMAVVERPALVIAGRPGRKGAEV
jgi:hypothetical protein